MASVSGSGASSRYERRTRTSMAVSARLSTVRTSVSASDTSRSSLIASLRLLVVLVHAHNVRGRELGPVQKVRCVAHPVIGDRDLTRAMLPGEVPGEPGGLVPLFPGHGLYRGLGLCHVRYLSCLGFTPLVLCVIIPGLSDNAHTMPTVLAVARQSPPPSR